jgi:hypothetical protein
VVEGVLGADASVEEAGGDVSKLNLNRDDREGVEGAVMTNLLSGQGNVLEIPTYSARC